MQPENNGGIGWRTEMAAWRSIESGGSGAHQRAVASWQKRPGAASAMSASAENSVSISIIYRSYAQWRNGVMAYESSGDSACNVSLSVICGVSKEISSIENGSWHQC
jgi:hypothetical protein